MEQYHLSLADELVAMAAADQDIRNRAAQTGKWDARVDAANTARMKEVVDEHGWPAISVVGAAAAHAAWLLVQHADSDPSFQEGCLELMKRLGSGEVSPADLAYLEDRVRVNTGRPQLYGTQFYRQGEHFGPRPIEDEANLETRRLAAGLEPFTQYRERVTRLDERRWRASGEK